MGYTKANAAKYAGYSGANSSIFSAIAKRLLSCETIRERIMEIQTTMYDVDTVRKDIIGWYRSYDLFEFGSVVTPNPIIDTNGNPKVNYIVKKYENWTPLEKAMFKGVGKSGLPEFYDKVDGKKELCKIFGLYKENAISEEEDIDSVFAGAGVSPSIKSKVSATRNLDGSFDEDEENEALEKQLNELLELEESVKKSNPQAEVKSITMEELGADKGITLEEPVVDTEDSDYTI